MANKSIKAEQVTTLVNNIKTLFVKKADTEAVSVVDVDSAPTTGSTNLVTSGGVKTAIDAKQDVIDSSHKLPYAYVSGTPTIPSIPAYSNGKLVFTTGASYDSQNQKLIINNV